MIPRAANSGDFMTLSQTIDSVKRCAASMNARYGKTVFNEWAIVSLQRGHERIVFYDGPRKEHFQKNFVNDLGSLRSEVLNTKHEPGHFDFARNEVGTGFEAFVCIGDELYLICNHTESSMHDIAQDARWLDAQKAFAELTETFRAEPLAA
jgi:FPC/CPF motif-containing protein YcgG